MSKITVIGSLFFYGNKYKAAVFFSRIELRGDNKVALFKDMAVSLGGSVVFILFRHNPIIVKRQILANSNVKLFL